MAPDRAARNGRASMARNARQLLLHRLLRQARRNLRSRISMPSLKRVCSGNPDSPSHSTVGMFPIRRTRVAPATTTNRGGRRRSGLVHRGDRPSMSFAREINTTGASTDAGRVELRCDEWRLRWVDCHGGSRLSLFQYRYRHIRIRRP